jgi:Type IV secretion system pilin
MPAGHDLPGCPLHPNSPGDPSVHRIHRVLDALLLVAVCVLAAPIAVDAASPPTLNAVIGSLQLWVVGLLAGLATLFLTIGGIRYMTAGGDPGQIERAKSALRSAAIGYALAALSPLLVAILQSIVGSS